LDRGSYLRHILTTTIKIIIISSSNKNNNNNKCVQHVSSRDRSRLVLAVIRYINLQEKENPGCLLKGFLDFYVETGTGHLHRHDADTDDDVDGTFF